MFETLGNFQVIQSLLGCQDRVALTIPAYSADDSKNTPIFPPLSFLTKNLKQAKFTASSPK